MQDKDREKVMRLWKDFEGKAIKRGMTPCLLLLAEDHEEGALFTFWVNGAYIAPAKRNCDCPSCASKKSPEYRTLLASDIVTAFEIYAKSHLTSDRDKAFFLAALSRRLNEWDARFPLFRSPYDD